MNTRKKIRDAIRKVTSLFQSTRLYKRLHEMMLNFFVANDDEYYSYEEPSPRKMRNKKFWMQIIDKEEDSQ